MKTARLLCRGCCAWLMLSICASFPAAGTAAEDSTPAVGIVVRDIEAKVRAWADILNLPVPEIVLTDAVAVAHTEYNGRPSPAQAKLAFFPMGQVEIELIEPVGEPSTWKVLAPKEVSSGT